MYFINTTPLKIQPIRIRESRCFIQRYQTQPFSSGRNLVNVFSMAWYKIVE